MSGGSDNGSGCGKGQDCGSGGGSPRCKNRSPKSNFENDKKEMKFTPKVARKSQGHTYDAVKEHIPKEIQKELLNGKDVVDNLRAGADSGIKESEPTRKKSPKIEVIRELLDIKRMEAAEEQRIDQEGPDMDCRVESEKHA